ncbi:MAG: hypothetical protein AAF561_13385 [Planctomycetota bacterium]
MPIDPPSLLVATERSDAQEFLATGGRILLVLIGAIVLLLIGLWAKRHFLDDDEPEGISMSGFGIGELRRLHKDGKLSDAEFERARNRLVATAKREHLEDEAEAPPADRPRGKNLDLIRDLEES